MATINHKKAARPWIAEKKGYDTKTSTINQKFYNSKDWRDFSKAYKQANLLCINFDSCHGVTKYTDHITPIREGGAKFDLQNLQPLCRSCNAKKTGKQRWRKSE